MLFFLKRTDPAIKKSARRYREVSMGVPGFRVSPWIVNRHIQLHRILIYPLVALDQVELVGGRMPHLVEPYLSIESDGIHNQRVSILIMADRIAPPSRIRVLRMVPVHPHRPPIGPKLIQ